MDERTRQHGRNRAKFFLFFSLILVLLSIYIFNRTPAAAHRNVCMLFEEQPDWYRDAKNTDQQWGVPIATQMAIIHQESHYLAAAKPIKAKVFGVFAVHPTTAVGYAQVIDQTWHLYLQQTHQFSADRQSFASASDFIGWFARRAQQQLGISKDNTYELYLAYHEGLQGYRQGDYKRKRWLIEVASHVSEQAKRYQHQLLHCQSRLDRAQQSVFSAAPMH